MSSMIHVQSCFFYRNKHIMIDHGTSNNNKINWALNDKNEFLRLCTEELGKEGV